MVNSEKNALQHQNKAIKDFLAKQSIDTAISAINLNDISPLDDEMSYLGGATLDFRIDPDLGQERIFLDMLDMPEVIWTSSETTSTDESTGKHLARHAPVAVSWTGDITPGTFADDFALVLG